MLWLHSLVKCFLCVAMRGSVFFYKKAIPVCLKHVELLNFLRLSIVNAHASHDTNFWKSLRHIEAIRITTATKSTLGATSVCLIEVTPNKKKI